MIYYIKEKIFSGHLIWTYELPFISLTEWGAKYYLGDQIKKNDVGGACSMYRGRERCIQDFSGETWGTETTWKTQA
jgi:hypothetical protein